MTDKIANVDQAKILAERFLFDNRPRSARGDKFVISRSGIIEEEDGWYFPFQTEDYVRTRDMNLLLVGNAPIFVSRNGKVGFRTFGAPFFSAQ